MGDAANWEWLLAQDYDVFLGDLVIVSADGDYESDLTKGKLRQFLILEWQKKHAGCSLHFFKSLPEFMKAHFPDIQLADEIDKVEAIEHLEQSGSFAATHSAISKLMEYDDYKGSEVLRLLKAFKQNSQVAWILGDEDVRAFAKKILALAKSPESQELAAELNASLVTLDTLDGL